MYKIYFNKRTRLRKLLSKCIITMKITAFFIMAMLVHVQAATYGQKVTLNFKNASLSDVLNEIQKQTGYDFLYNSSLINTKKKISISVKGAELKDALRHALGNQDLVLDLDSKTVLIKQKTKVPSENQNSVVIQQIVRGRVLSEDGAPLGGVSVSVVGSAVSTSTDDRGSYAIEAKSGDQLLFTFMGYKDVRRQVLNEVTIDVILQEDLSALEEVVVVGMGQQKKASVIGAISTVKMEDLKVPSRSLTNALAGKMAGAVVLQRTGELGRDNGSIWIRGVSSFSENRSPLILVDGVERDMQDLSVEEIESVSILKDASATAVYGVRAANGVVLVTTKRGVAQKPVIQFGSEFGASDLPNLPKFLDGPNYAMLYNEALGRENYSQEYIYNTQHNVDPYLYPNVNWYDEIYKKYARNAQASLNVRGGGEVARYFVGFGYINENGNLKDSPDNDYKSNLSLNRYNFRSNIDVTVTRSTTLELEVGGSLTDLHSPGVGGNIYGTSYTPAGELFYWSSLATPISNPVKIPIDKDLDENDIMGWAAPTQVGEKNPLERLMGSGFNT